MPPTTPAPDDSQPCPACYGTGKDNDGGSCWRCEGLGYIDGAAGR